MRLPRAPEQLRKPGNLLACQMPKLAQVALANLLIELHKQVLARGGQTHVHRAPVVGWALSLNQAVFVELVQQTGDVRGAGYQPARQYERWNFCRMRRAQKPQGVVLLGSQLKAAEQLVFERPQAIVSTPQVKKELLLRRIKPLPSSFGSFQYHACIIHVRTKVVQTIIEKYLRRRE